MRSSIFALGVAAVLGGCASAKDAIVGPKLNEMSPPAIAASMQPSPTVIASSMEPPAYVSPQPIASANSLWRPGARAFFIDQRANRPGDILTVSIAIDDSADLSNSTDSKRANATNGKIPHFLGFEQTLGKMLFPEGYDPANAIEQSGDTTSAGSGAMKRQERISMTIAAVVTGVLPNGNLIIQGRQQVKTNNELRDLTISGIVRPQDISSSNTIRHTQIAEARISYGGRGDLTRVQRTPPGQALMQQFSPF